MPFRLRTLAPLLTCVIACMLAPAVAQAAWTQAWTGASTTSGGMNTSTSRDANEPALVVNGVPYVAWAESDGVNSEVRVARLNGSTWEQPWTGVSATSGGINQSTSHDAFGPALTVAGGVVYVAWREDDGTNSELRVARLNGS